MFDTLKPTTSLKRPRILARAARAGANLYQRDRDLKRILPSLIGKRRSVDIVGRLTEAEAACEEARRTKSFSYSIDRHVQLLTALVAEAAGLNRMARG